MATKSVTDQEFESQVIQSNKPVLVDFWAEWCGPCVALGPKLEELSDSYGEQVEILKLDIDKNPDAPVKFGVKGVPTMILFKGGEVVEQLVGNQPEDTIKGMIEKHLA